MLKEFEIYLIKKKSVGLKRLFVLRDIVPRGVFLLSRGVGVLNTALLLLRYFGPKLLRYKKSDAEISKNSALS